MYADVLIQYSTKELDKTFTYKIPTNLTVFIGNKVKVQFNNKKIYGIVLNIKASTEYDEVLEILEVINPEIILNQELIELGKYLKDITLCSLMKAYQTMLPTGLKVKETSSLDKYIEFIELNKDRKVIIEYIKDHKKSYKQIEILEYLLENKKINKKDTNLVYKKLLEKDLIKIVKKRIYRLESYNYNKINYELTKEQQSVVDKVELNKKNTYLLYGITGSGKTIR